MKRVYSYNPKAHVGPAVSKNGNKQATSSRHDPDMLFRRFTALLYHFKTLQNTTEVKTPHQFWNWASYISQQNWALLTAQNTY